MAEMLDHGPEDVVAQLLIDRGFGTDPLESRAWPVKVNDESSDVDESINVFGYEGRIDGRSMATGIVHSHPAIQIKVKGRNQLVARAKMKAIVNDLDANVYHATVTMEGGTVYCLQSLSKTSTFNWNGSETQVSQRDVYTVNYLVTVRQMGL